MHPTTGRFLSSACGKDKKLATNFADKKRRELSDGIIADVRHVTWVDFAREHVSSLSGRQNQKDVERTLRQFAEACNPNGPHLVTYAMVESYVQLRRGNVSPNTINRELRELRASSVAWYCGLLHTRYLTP